jgi:hypothetical protein
MPTPNVPALPAGWRAVTGNDAAELEQELARELSAGHVLHGVEMRAIAVRRHLKDVVYWLPATERWALVHLTGRVEADPRWPSTFQTSEWDALVDEVVD